MTDTKSLFAVDVSGLQMRYGKTQALSDVSLKIPRGTTVALIGPNGAGKSTFVEILMGLRRPNEGSVSVLGYDVIDDPRAHVDRIGVQLQETRLFMKVTLRDYFLLFEDIYSRIEPTDVLAERLSLTEVLDKRLGHLSGGQRQRAALALAVVNDPDLIILDEPTVGLDPLARQEFWDHIRDLQGAGKTLLFSTHYMDEAQALADEIVMISKGRIVAKGTAEEIVQSVEKQGAKTLDEAYGAVVANAQKGAAA